MALIAPSPPTPSGIQGKRWGRDAVLFWGNPFCASLEWVPFSERSCIRSEETGAGEAPSYVCAWGAKIEGSGNTKRVIIVLCSVITHRVSAQGDVCFPCRHRIEQKGLLLSAVQGYRLLPAFQEASLGSIGFPGHCIVD